MTSSIRGVKFGPDDKAALDLFLRMTPSGEGIRRFLSVARHVSGRSHQSFYDAGTYTATYVTTWKGYVA